MANIKNNLIQINNSFIQKIKDYLTISVQNLQIGGTNLVGLHSHVGDLTGSWKFSAWGPNNKTTWTVTGTSKPSYNFTSCRIHECISEPGDYVISFDIKPSIDVKLSLDLCDYGMNNGTATSLKKNIWNHCLYKGSTDRATNPYTFVDFNFYYPDPAIYEIKNLKLEKGHKSTGWTICPKNIKYYWTNSDIADITSQIK